MFSLTIATYKSSEGVNLCNLDVADGFARITDMGNKTTPYGALLRERRVKAGLSLREVADYIGVSHVFLADVERGLSSPLKQDRETRLLEIMPTVTAAELHRARVASKPIKITPTNERYHDLTMALARRIERENNLSDSKFNLIMSLLSEDSDDD